MAKPNVERKTIEDVFAAIPHLLRLPANRMWVDYDRDADVLYLSLKRPQRATDTQELDEEGVLLSFRGQELVGITVLDASKRSDDARTGSRE